MRKLLSSIVLVTAMLLQPPPPPVPFETISGAPLTIYVAQDGSYQVDSADAGQQPRGQVYSSLDHLADAGFFVHAGGYALGPDFDHHPVTSANVYDQWSSATQTPLAGAGTLEDPWVITTTLTHTPTLITLTLITKYVNGEQSMGLTGELCTPEDLSGSIFLAGNLSFDDYVVNDLGVGQHISGTGTIGGLSQDGTWAQTLYPLPLNTDVAYFAGLAPDLWAALGAAGAPGPGLNDTVATTPVDLAAGLQWAFQGPGCNTVAARWFFTPGNAQPKPQSIWLPLIVR